VGAGAEVPNLAGLQNKADPPDDLVDVTRYPPFDTFSLIDRDGMQQFKSSPAPRRRASRWPAGTISPIGSHAPQRAAVRRIHQIADHGKHD
jgi:hypothetical protein